MAVNGVIREHRIFRRLSDTATHSSFLQTLYYSFLHDESPIMVFSRGSGFDLHDLIENFYPLSEEETIFYCSEVISGLLAIHAMGIFHLDIKSENILLSNAGHAIISDFDCAYELAYNAGPPKPKDYRGTCYYMAPEIASKHCIRYEADSWGVGTVMACLPRFPANFYHSIDPLDINKLDAVSPNLNELSRSGMTPHRIRHLLENFNFVNDSGLHNEKLS